MARTGRSFVDRLAYFFVFCFGFCVLSIALPAALLGQTGQWTWVGGNNQPNLAGSYGTQGVFAASNLPGGRGAASFWTDAQNRMWFFGGAGMISPNLYGNMDDMWIFDPAMGSHGEWTWQAGPQNPADFGVTGPQGEFSDQFVPAARLGAMSWMDSSGRLWLFGGWIYSGPYLDDLWVFDPTKGAFGQWAWMGSSLATSAPGVYGTLGVPAPTNSPGARGWGATWTDRQGNLWLFGGGGIDANGNGGALNDVWIFQPSLGQFGEWTWVGGKSIIPKAGLIGKYGTQGDFALTNMPGGRNGSAVWTDSQGHVWLFGGVGVDAVGNQGNLADMWQFNPSLGKHGEWAFMGGNEEIIQNTTGVFGTAGVPAPANLPEARNWAQTWKDSYGNFWMYGGDDDRIKGGPTALYDVWVYSPTLQEWALIDMGSPVPNYGTEYVAAPSNFPGERDSGAVLTDSSDNALIFGGRSLIDLGLNDLWQYTPAPTAGEPSFSPPGGYYGTAQHVTITSATAGAAIYYTTDGSIPSASSIRYTAPVTVAPAQGSVETLNAIAVASSSDYLYSPMQSATYAIIPAAALTSIAPISKTVGGPQFTLTVKGTNFVDGCSVQWNGSNRVTKFVKSSEVTATITAADLESPGTVAITVANPGTAPSNAESFTVKNPKPALTSLSPANATHGGSAFTLVVKGSNFVPGSVVKWKGSARATTFVSAEEVTAEILATDIAKAGSATVVATNPLPGGGSSSPLTFTVQ